MLFSSITFLYCFLPCVLLVYFVVPDRMNNAVLLLASLFFYGWGEPKYLIFMLASVTQSYAAALLVERFRWTKIAKAALAVSAAASLGLLAYCKYADFFIGNFNAVTGLSVPLLRVALPVGISFYTFQILSYVIDVYRGDVPVQRNFIDLAMYVAMFPQLIAGPIVRYSDIAGSLKNRKTTLSDMSTGAERFIIGLAKKVLVADILAATTDDIFGRMYTGIDVPTAWLGVLLYALVIYTDFSGYSDMAIGLGQMLGFNFNKNFDYPYISTSVSEFWRRWHISLGSWFRDYIYIPLGGNRVSTGRHIRNILVVWALTGLWHGASWNFVFWGIYYGLLLLAEKFLLGRFLEKAPVWLRNLYTMFAVIIGWVFFSQTTPAAIGKMLGSMFGFGASCFADRASLYALKSGLILMIISVISCRPGLYQYFKRLARRNTYLAAVINAILFFLCIAYMIYSSYTPFMYQQF